MTPSPPRNSVMASTTTATDKSTMGTLVEGLALWQASLVLVNAGSRSVSKEVSNVPKPFSPKHPRSAGMASMTIAMVKSMKPLLATAPQEAHKLAIQAIPPRAEKALAKMVHRSVIAPKLGGLA